MSWEQTTLGDHIDLISGPAFKSAHFTEDRDDVPLIKGENIAQGYIAWEKSRYWPRNEFQDYKKYWLEAGDIVLAMDRPWIPAGLKWAEIKSHDPSSLLVQRVARLRTGEDLHQRFLKYLVASKGFSDYIQNIMYGTNVPHISGKQIKAFSFLLPDLPTQERIAAILSAYDDLIENNRRRIALLEQAARLLFREWFVHFRFPGHETVKFVDGLPDGWDRTGLSKVCSTNKASYKKGKIPDPVRYIDIGSVSTGRIDGVTEYRAEDAPGRARRIAEPMDTIWSNVRPNLQAYSLVMTPKENDVFSTGFTVLHAETVSPLFLYLTVTTDDFVKYLTNHATGASYPAVRSDDFDRAEVLVPTEKLMSTFHKFAEPIFQQRQMLGENIDQLSNARDLLLPRLMDGRIPV